jgi:hypothetical protein
MVPEGRENLYHELAAGDIVYPGMRRYLLAHLIARHKQA